MAVNQKEADSEHVLSSISEMTSAIGSSITQGNSKFTVYRVQMQITASFQLQSFVKN